MSELLHKKLNERDQKFFEQAIKFYFFTRQRNIKTLNTDLRARFKHDGNVAYSLIIKFLEEDEFKFDYMEFINDELVKLRALDPELLRDLTIKPGEINEIELLEEVSLSFTDEENDHRYDLIYIKKESMLEYRISTSENRSPGLFEKIKKVFASHWESNHINNPG